jgi:DUF218 domain-containing protein
LKSQPIPDKKESRPLFRRREILLPTWRLALPLALAFVILAVIGCRQLHPFLAVSDPVAGEFLVVEGWATDFAMQQAVTDFRNHRFERVCVTGGPLEAGAPLSEYKTYAERGAAVLLKLGLTTNEVLAVPAPRVRQDRTYTAAVGFAKWLRESRLSPARVHLVTEGPHARRSRLLLSKALGGKIKVGVTAVPVADYDEKHWWKFSAGVRGVIGELLAYGYARLLFREPPSTPMPGS